MSEQEQVDKVPCTCGAVLVTPYPNDTGCHSTTECLPASVDHAARASSGDES